ncbi:RHS repeat-associated core domain-containing protein [Flavobacterium sp. TAB 87]|uniref:RHS repeat-associated core domain-containing protein n=1 Tax=Flavobacterium sp. TAB 87 TaxID=1729581 RepID=UPI00076D25E0|nr:RHS repeat-associated core domain-containing protein [Flavobacterium sp. TAB 87]KVV15065.1 RHS repeat-associated core domain protein [Flavobacterium sp. TAB 87]
MNPYKYKYNGKELQDELQLNVYDMSARNYDPATGRFTTFDPITHYSQSPYSAFNGNPVYWADPSGMEGEHYNWNTGQYVNKAGQNISFEDAMAGNGMNADGSKKNGSNDNSTGSTTETFNTSDINPKEAFEYEKKYPRTMQVLRQVRGYVKSNPKILEALSEYSGYSTMEVLDKLKYSNSSVSMEIRELKSLHSYNPYGLNNGSAAFYLNIQEAQRLETVQTNEEIQAFSFFIAVTIIHEFVHVARKANKKDAGREVEEMGWGWEQDSYGGKRVDMSTYKELYKQSNWNLKDNKYKYKLSPLF